MDYIEQFRVMNPLLSSVAAKTGLCRTWSETPKPVFSHGGSFVD